MANEHRVEKRCMRSKPRKTILIAAGSIVALGFLGAFEAAQYRSESSRDISKLFNLCMSSTPGSGLDELKRLFGEPTEVRAQDSKTTYYEFGDEEYLIATSDEIRATQDKESGKIVRLTCGEHSVAWSLP